MKNLGKYLSDPGMIRRKLEWSLLRRFRRDAQVTVNTWNGRLTFDVADGLIGKHLFVRRAFERDFLLKAYRFLDQHGLRSAERDVLADVGANIGMIAIAAVRHGCCREAIAVEPSPGNFELLLRNVQQNDHANLVHARQLALSSQRGTLELVTGGDNSGAHRVLPEPARESQSPDADAMKPATVSVEATTFDELLTSDLPHLVDRLGLVWVDIEGHEAQFFQGAGVIASHRIPVVCEFFPRLIEQHGTPREAYLEVVVGGFTHFALLDESAPSPRPIDELPAFYDAQHAARDAVNLMLFHQCLGTA
ncbi:MAG: FkbM family methyltransferase [Pirellulaceae bacterium]